MRSSHIALQVLALVFNLLVYHAESGAILNEGGKSSSKRPMFGVDYYPEQWPKEEMGRDLHRIRQELGADVVRVAEFSWHLVEPTDGKFDFSFWEQFLDAAHQHGLRVILGTPTATLPAWLAKKHPEVLSRDKNGIQRSFGGRRLYSFNSETYLSYALRVTTRMAEKLGEHPALEMWQIDNEIGHEGSDDDYNDASVTAWRVWLSKKYNSSIAQLNQAWGTVFWSETYNGFDEVPAPLPTITHHNPGLQLDWRRFRSDSILAFLEKMAGAVRQHSKSPIMTNFPGGFFSKKQDFSRMARVLDVAGYDNYPVWGEMENPDRPARVALRLDIVRSLGLPSGGRPFLIPEQLIGAQGHTIIGFRPRPGQAFAWAAQAMTHGASEGVLFFRYRAAPFGTEEFCYGVLDHDDVPRQKWTETKAFYEFGRKHADLLRGGAGVPKADVALLYSYENAWAWQAQPQSTSFDYENELARFHEPFFRHGAAVDVLDASFAVEAIKVGSYKVVLLPPPMIISDGLYEALQEHVLHGGSLWIGFRSDMKDARNQMRQRSTSRLAKLAGVTVEDFESLNAMRKPVVPKVGTSTEVGVWRDLLKPVPDMNTEILYEYDDAAAKGFAALTRRLVPKAGEVIYVGAGFDADSLVSLADASLTRSSARNFRHNDIGSEVELAYRTGPNGHVNAILLSFSETPKTVAGIELSPFEVRVVPIEDLQSEPIEFMYN